MPSKRRTTFEREENRGLDVKADLWSKRKQNNDTALMNGIKMIEK